MKLTVLAHRLSSQARADTLREVEGVAADYALAVEVVDELEPALAGSGPLGDLLVAVEGGTGLEERALPAGSVIASRQRLSPAVRAALLTRHRRVVEGRGDNSAKWAMRYILANREVSGIPMAYGAQPLAQGDLRLPPGARRESLPAVMLLHGGFWRAQYERDMMEEIAVDLAGRGIATWNIDYRSSADAPWPACRDDARAALALLIREAPRIGIDRTRIAALGHSAGGHLALLLAAGPEAAHLHSVWALAPIADLESAARDGLGDGAIPALLGPDAGPEAAAAASPISYPPLCPIALFHGNADVTVPAAQSHAYVSAIGQGEQEVRLKIFSGARHMDLVKRHGNCWRTVAALLADALGA